MLDTIPGEISYNDTSLSIHWKDGRQCSYDLLSLRKQCPCAMCRGGHESNSVRTTDGITQIKLISWKKIGRYAIGISWSDGHDLGIYTYDALRESCEKSIPYAG